VTELVFLFFSVAFFKFAKFEDFLFLKHSDEQAEHELLFSKGTEQNSQ